MNLAHKIELVPTIKQEELLFKAAGCARFTWNWALNECNEHYKATDKFINMNELKKRWNVEKPEWVYESPKDTNQQPFTTLRKTFMSAFKHKNGLPNFKKKGKTKDSFYLSNDKFLIKNNTVRIPKIGLVKLTEELRFNGKIVSGVVSRTADKWFLSVCVETAIEPPATPINNDTIGVDLGLNHFAVCSDGSVFDAPKPLKQNIKTLQRLSKKHSRKQSGSKNKIKASKRLARFHYKVSCIRNDFLHKVSTELVSKAKILVLEDLNVQGMSKNRKLVKSILDSGLSEFRRQITYKCEKNGIGLVIADRWFPSTQICSVCGDRHPMKLSDRIYECHKCGTIINRDLNAAINLSTVGMMESKACGQEGSDFKHMFVVKPSWLKQELNHAIRESCYK